MDVRILGGFSVRENGVSITPTAAAPRQLLALLAANADQLVPVTVLTEELWPSGAPRAARAELQYHIAELRSLIASALRDAEREAAHRAAAEQGMADHTRPHPARGSADTRTAESRTAESRFAGSRSAGSHPAEPQQVWTDHRTADAILVHQPGGYRLDTGGGANDVWQFERAAGAGYRAMEAGDLPRAALRLGEALALWRGEPYAGVAAGPGLRREIERLETSRLSVLDQWVEAQLGLGRHAELLAELSGLVARYRTNEPLCAHYMVALLRCGHLDEALAAFERLRAALAAESAMEPSARLCRLQRSVLTMRSTAVRSVLGSATRLPGRTAVPGLAGLSGVHVPVQYSPASTAPAPAAPAAPASVSPVGSSV
ncbi:BTAD domain-containing putative transcriptional regulator [Streptomyces sp. NPDC056144]|uniref:AfsR/SARP family transcriptional regulator n=1 Tax=unclassified Streptomyces TaxID=2593676 RepID=UPI0035D69383